MKINGRDCFDSQNIPVEGALFEREAQILTARQGIAGTTGFVGTRKTATPSSHPKKPSLADGILGPPGPQPAPH
jgi:hypothetical protein